MSSSYTLSLEQLSADVFAPFGDVASRPIVERRRYLPTMLNRSDAAQTFSFWISSVPAVCTLPLRVTRLERHPYSAQTFVPLGSARYLVIVCARNASADPNLETLRGFVARPEQVVTYGRNVWHHPMAVLDSAMEFAVAMALTGQPDDDVFCNLDQIVTGMPLTLGNEP
jgi:ureidoglycolate lyase